MVTSSALVLVYLFEGHFNVKTVLSSLLEVFIKVFTSVL